jgi:GGDEF domain-containing protein
MQNVANKLDGAPDPAPTPNSEPKVAAPSLPEVVKPMQRATSDLAGQKDGRRLVADLRDAMGENGTIVLKENVPGKYAVAYADGKVTIELDASVLRRKVSQVRTTMIDAMTDAMAVIDREWAEGIPFMAGRDLRKDLSVFLANPGQLRQEAPQVFDVIQKRFDNNTQRRNMMAGLQGRDRLRYHQFANYERAGIGAELEVGIDEADIKQYAPEDFYINGDYRRQMSNKVADAREKYEGTAIGNHLSRMQNTLDRVSSYLDSWMRIYYPGPLNLRKDNPARGEMWEKYFQIKTTVYRRYGEYMERNLSLIEEMGDAAPFDQSLSQILSQLGFGFQFTKDGKKLRTIAWFDETGRAERKISVAFYAKDAFLQQFFGKNVVNMENLRDLVMSAPYRGVDTVWNPKQFERVAEEITEDVVGEVAEDVMKVAPIKLDDAQRQVVKDKLGFELDETGTMKLEDRRQNTLLRNALNKAMRGETLAADEAMELGKLAAQSSTTGLRNKAYYWLIHHGSEFARPTKTMIDVDYLKFFNDFGGHPQGDVILQTFANDLKDIVGNEHVFHLSGDEFFADFDTPEQAEEIMQQVYNKFREHDFIFREVIDGKPTGQEIVAKGDFKWGTAADEFEADQKLIAKKAADRKIRGAEPSGISRRTASAGVEGIPSGTPPAAGRKYVPLTDEDWAKITEVVTTVDPVQTARNTYSQNITKIKDPQAVALIQAEAQEMMDDIFDLDVWDGRPLGDEDFVEYIGKTEWGADLVEVLKKQKNPRTALIEAFEQVISGKGSASNLTKNLRQQIVKNLETGLGNRPAHPYMRKLLGLPEDEAIAKSWSDLGRNPMRELEQMVDTRQNEQALWDAFSQQEWYDGRSLKSAWGNNARNPEVFAAHLRDLIKNLPDGVQDSSIEALQMLLFQVQNYKALRNNFNGLFGTRRSWRLGKNSHVPLSKTIGSMPDNYQQWFLNAEEAAQTVDGIDAGLRKWKDYAKNKPDLGLQEADLDALEVSAEEIARLKQSLLNMAAFGPDEKNLETLLRDSFGWVTRQKDNVWQRRVGNEWQNLSKKEMGMFQRVQNVLTEQANILKGAGDVEGALQRTNRFMIDYGDFSRLDEMMRYVVPFWKFTSRSFPFWIETLATHPQILAAYGKYINFTRRVQMQEGIRTSTGEQMPSLEGYLPIPGTDMWFNPLAPLSFRYVIPKYRNYGDENENMPIMGQVFNWLQDYSQVFGVGLNPMFVAPWKIMGHLDNKPTSALVPQINLMPPWYLNSIRGYVNKIGGPVAQDAAEVILGSELPWMDYMVERRLLANLSEEIRRDPARATELVAKMELAIREREGSELWNETRREMENSDLARNWAGYFTAMYAKEFTDAEVDFQHLRDDLNFHRSMVNDQIGAEVFGLDPDVVNRYEHYTHTAYETPEGAQVNLYNNLRWVQSPTGEELQGQERRDAVVAKLDQQEVTAKYHEALEHNYEWYQSQLKALPVGADSKLRQKLYQQFIQYRDEIEGSELYDTATRGWAMGYKPEELVYEHFQSLWWQIVEETKPQYDGEDYNAYQLQVAQWTSDLPYIATTLASAAGLNQMLTTQLKVEELPEGMPMAGGRELNVQNLVQKLIAETTPELYEQWSKGKDTPMRAMDKAWQELYWNKYWDTMRDLSGYERELVEQNFILNFPKPSTEMMVNWVMQNYPGQFDPKMLQDAVQDRKVESVASRLAPKDPQATMEQDVWDTLSMAGPNKDALQKAYEQMGGYWASDISGLWYGSGGSSSAWSDPEKFQMFHDRLMEAAASLGLQEPDALTLKEWAQAQDLDAKRKAFLDEKLGADYMDNMRAYWAADKRTRYEMRKADPTIDEYYRIQDGWEEQYPIWAKYYTEQESTSTKTSTGSGGGGGGYTRRSYSSGGGSGSSYVPASYTLGMGARSTLDASRLPGSLGKAKPGGSIRIPAALQGIIGEAATAEIESGEPISQKTQDFLKKVEKRHPEHKEIIRTIIGGKPVSGNVLKEMQ